MRRFALLLALAALAAGAPPASAAEIEVKVMQNGGPLTVCTLRRAIQNANADDDANIGCDGGSGADVIRFDIDTENVVLTLDQPLPEITDDLTIRGRSVSKTRISGGDALRPLQVAAGVTLTLESLTLEAGDAGIGDGGLLLALAGSDVVLRDCHLDGGTATGGGLVATIDGTLRIERCLLEGGTATDEGGAVLVDGGDAELVNTTVSGNAADMGGGVAVVGVGTAALRSVTLAENDATEGGNLVLEDGSLLDLRHTLLALAGAGDNCSGGTPTSSDHNLADDLSCALGGAADLEGTAAGIAALAQNGGPTRTHALQPGSAAIDAGATSCRDAQGVLLATDQRGAGFPRRTDGDGLPGFECDIGAFEAAPEPAGGAAAGAAALALAALARRRPSRVP